MSTFTTRRMRMM